MKIDIIKKMEDARLAHIQWARYQEKRRRQGKELAPNAGGPTHHRRWIKIYEAVIKELKARLRRNNGNRKR